MRIRENGKEERKEVYVAYASMYAYNCAGICMCVLEDKKNRQREI